MNDKSNNGKTGINRRAWRVSGVRTVVLGCLCVGLIGGGAYAATTQPTAPPPVPAVAAVPASEAAAYRVLRGPVASSIPPQVTSIGEDSVFADLGANPALARVTYRAGDRTDPWYVVPADGKLCFYVLKESQGACATEADAAGGHLAIVGATRGSDGKIDPAQGAQSVFALVPDDVSGATALTTDGDVPVAVDNNVLEFSKPGIQALRLKLSSGAALVVPLAP